MKKEMYYLYIDDSGSRLPDKKPTVVRRDKMDHFAIGGILIKESDKDLAIQMHKDFCDKWEITYPLHSTEIRNKRGKFAWLEESAKKNERFLGELEELLIALPVIGFAAVVDRPGYNERYQERYQDKRWWMCETAYPILIERVAKYMREKNGLLKVRFERAGTKEEKRIIRYAKGLTMSGHPFNKDTATVYEPVTSDEYKEIIHGKPQKKPKAHPLVQFADLFLFPMAKHGYTDDYRPWDMFYKNGKVINAHLPDNMVRECGIKYSCFELVRMQKARTNPS